MNALSLGFAVALLAAAAPAARSHDDERPKPAFDASKAVETPFGIAADPGKAVRTIRIDMKDTLRFEPAEIRVKRGDIVRFVVSNKGRAKHEMVLGSREELAEHAEMMRKFPGMEHDEPHMVHVAPGRTGVMGWRFTRAGEFWYGCLLPGHFEGGMAGRILVE